MNFLSMEYFIAVMAKRNITKAAEEMHITQQTLSAHIAAIEQELACQLIIRRNPQELTYAGAPMRGKKFFDRMKADHKDDILQAAQALIDRGGT